MEVVRKLAASLRRPAGVACAALVFGVAGRGEAQTQLTGEGSDINTSNYTIDLYQGPVFSGSRITGLAGAFTPIAEGVPGYGYNPASAAQRVPWSVDWFDWELDAGVTFPSSITGTDFDNNGDDSFTNKAALFATGGLGLQFGRFGTGFTVDYSRYRLQPASGQQAALDVSLIQGSIVAAYAFLKGQLVTGIGLSAQNVTITTPGADRADTELATVTGPAFTAGGLWAPLKIPVRIGASVRVAPKLADLKPTDKIPPDADGNYVIDPDPNDPSNQTYYLPRAIALPTEIQVGIAVQFFRPMNMLWINPHDDPDDTGRKLEREYHKARRARQEDGRRRIEEARSRGEDTAALKAGFEGEEERLQKAEDERVAAAKKADRERRRKPYLLMPRGKLLASFSVKLTAPAESGVGVQSFLDQKVQRSGEGFAFSPRLGLEGEAWPGYLILRGGTYYEPTRFRAGTSRVHGTGGLDIRIPIVWSVFGLLEDDTTFRVGGAVDGTLRYFGWSVTAGLWH
jgi:hypothetical protein